MNADELDRMFVYYRTAKGAAFRELWPKGRALRRFHRAVQRGDYILLTEEERRASDRYLDSFNPNSCRVCPDD